MNRLKWLGRLLVVGILWSLFLLASTISQKDNPRDMAIFATVVGSGLYTLVLYLTRRAWLPRLAVRPVRNAILLGIFNAAVVEALSVAMQNVFRAPGFAAGSTLLLDWLVTMPWYSGMVVIFVRVQNRRRFPLVAVLALGGLYEIGADGILGQITGGTNQLLNPSYWVLLGLVAYWQFILAYSSMLLPPACLLAQTPRPTPQSDQRRAALDVVRPLFWLAPYVAYLMVLGLVARFLQ